MRLQIINGPNLNLLGKREPRVYGEQSFESYFEQLKQVFSDLKIDYYQSNIEGEIINKLHEVGFDYDGVVLNAGAYTHTSIAIGDAIKAIDAPVIEVHISNVCSREDFRSISYISSSCMGMISGFGLGSYSLAIRALIDMVSDK